MSEPQSYTVATIGFEDRERRVLRNVLAISAHRVPAFRTYVPAPGICPHIVVINLDRAESLQHWQRYLEANGKHALFMTPVFLSRAPVLGVGKYVLHRPVVATRLFQLFEQVVTESHGFVPLSVFDPEDAPVVHGNQPPPAPTASKQSSANAPLPAPAVSAPPRATATPATPAAAGASSDDVVALVIDDSLPVRIQMHSALKSLATHVDLAETGEEGLDYIGKRPYSIVFLDVILPGKDGYEICRRIKKHPLQQRTPVIMLTGNSSPADRVKGKLAGCDTYLIKPVKQSVFEELVATFIRRPAAA
jgi:two-component system, cell cycle response regulator